MTAEAKHRTAVSAESLNLMPTQTPLGKNDDWTAKKPTAGATLLNPLDGQNDTAMPEARQSPELATNVTE